MSLKQPTDEFQKHPQIVNWVRKANLLDEQEEIVATDFTKPETFAEHKVLEDRAKKRFLTNFTAWFFILVALIIFLSGPAIIIVGVLGVLIFCIWGAVLYYKKLDETVLIITSKRLISIYCSIDHLRDHLPPFTYKPFKIHSIPWASILDVNPFELQIDDHHLDYGIRIKESEGSSTEKFAYLHDLAPFKYWHYIHGTFQFYEFLNNGMPKNAYKNLQQGEIELAESIFDQRPLHSSYVFTIVDTDIALDLNPPYTLSIRKAGADERKLSLYDPLLHYSGSFNTKTRLKIMVGDETIFNERNYWCWLIKLLLTYFYAQNSPEELDVFFSHKYDVPPATALVNSPLFGRYDISQLSSFKQRPFQKPRGHLSETAGEERKSGNYDFIDYYPSPDDEKLPVNNTEPIDPLEIVVTTTWITIGQFSFTYNDIASFCRYPSPYSSMDVFFLRLKAPIVYTTSSGQSSSTHYQYAFQGTLLAEYAKNLEEFLKKVLK